MYYKKRLALKCITWNRAVCILFRYKRNSRVTNLKFDSLVRPELDSVYFRFAFAPQNLHLGLFVSPMMCICFHKDSWSVLMAIRVLAFLHYSPLDTWKFLKLNIPGSFSTTDIPWPLIYQYVLWLSCEARWSKSLSWTRHQFFLISLLFPECLMASIFDFLSEAKLVRGQLVFTLNFFPRGLVRLQLPVIR